MTDERVRQALRGAAEEAPDVGDLWDRTARRARRRRRQRLAGGIAAAVVALGGLAVGFDALLADPDVDIAFDRDETVDAPSPDRRDADEVVDVDVGAVRITVPEQWEVVDVDDHVEHLDFEEHVDPDGYCPLPEDRPVVFVGARPPAQCDGEPLPAGVSLIADEQAMQQRARMLFGDDHAAVAFDDGVEPPSAAAWEDHERTELADLPALSLEAEVATDLPSDADPGREEQHRRERILLAPALGLIVDVRSGDHADEITAALDTLRPTGSVRDDAVVIGHRWPEGPPDGSEPRPVELWALDADARLQRWYQTTATESGEETLMAWPAATPRRFAAVLRVDGEARVVAGRPGEDGREVFSFPDAEMVPKPDAWSRDGPAVVWIDRDALTAGLAAWPDADALVAGEPPAVEQRVDVTGAEHPEAGPGVGSLHWDDDGDVLRDANWEQLAPIERDDDGLPRLPDPLRFQPAGSE